MAYRFSILATLLFAYIAASLPQHPPLDKVIVGGGIKGPENLTLPSPAATSTGLDAGPEETMKTEAPPPHTSTPAPQHTMTSSSSFTSTKDPMKTKASPPHTSTSSIPESGTKESVKIVYITRTVPPHTTPTPPGRKDGPKKPKKVRVPLIYSIPTRYPSVPSGHSHNDANLYGEYNIDCHHQPNTTNIGVDNGELTTFLYRNWNRDTSEYSFVLPSGSNEPCQQISCIGKYATLSICYLGGYEDRQPFTISGSALRDATHILRDIMFPERPWEADENDPSIYSTLWVMDNKKTFSCCSQSDKPGLLETRSSDRFQGWVAHKERKNVVVSIMPVEPLSRNGTSIPRKCDAAKNLKQPISADFSAQGLLMGDIDTNNPIFELFSGDHKNTVYESSNEFFGDPYQGDQGNPLP
ncbi:hypothetical protein ABW21_db0200602 [Orbilia brochopaga]|nr:hypothetical protein ABW21_db0200602 [Drechslerella brochopaga]